MHWGALGTFQEILYYYTRRPLQILVRTWKPLMLTRVQLGALEFLMGILELHVGPGRPLGSGRVHWEASEGIQGLLDCTGRVGRPLGAPRAYQGAQWDGCRLP